jgi:hypothetical protein
VGFRSRVVPFVVAAAGAAACGLDEMGTGGALDEGVASGAGDAQSGAQGSGMSADGSSAASNGDAAASGDALAANDGGGGVVDANDAGPTYVAPVDAGSPIIYVVSGRFWTVNPTSGQWSGGSSLPTGGCPSIDEIAIDAFGQGYVVGGGNLYKLASASPSCTQIGSASAYPLAMAFAPGGTVDPTAEALVGYLSNGDYVKVNTASGAVTVITPGALGGFSPGDIVNVGGQGYAAVYGSTCSSNCLYTFDWKTGALVTNKGSYGTSQHVLGLAQWGGEIFAFGETDTAFKGAAATPAGAASFAGPPGYTNVTYKAAASTTIAPAM